MSSSLIPSQVCAAESDSTVELKPASGFFQTPVLSLIHLHQQRISPNSIQRCPFKISCSHFAEEAVSRDGAASGILKTIDRLYFRENKEAFSLYPRLEGEGGRLLLDDGFYLASTPVTSHGSISRPAQSTDVAIAIRSATTGVETGELLEWADRLYHNEDFTAARLIYGRIEETSSDREMGWLCHIQQVKCYTFEDQYVAAISMASEALGDSLLEPAKIAETETLIAYIYMLQRIIPLAETHYRKALDSHAIDKANIGLGLIALESGNWSKSDSIRAQVIGTFQCAPEISLIWKNSIDQGKHLALRRPWLAASMSAIVPGAGQFYSGHHFDGAQAFAFVTGFAYATYMAYRYESTFNKPRIGTTIGGSLTLAFYTANVWGGKQTALYRNMRMRSEVCRGIRTKFDELMK